MIAKIKCWWRGHVIKAWIGKDVETGYLAYQYYCERCNCLLLGPRP